ncbi:hypothetical protein VCUG_01904 [Vavraia culicis subsp. floridensis]|uniref:C2H2-type domain-containing protein n=1 Tax=Vavraia culicis (isolate floridensis) TaxID=948595 RepID=L2GU40_VAVCU|nr:uncharacterized protein VCUG_01904 [Vavraia culicis subsp. floridensis]ELA46620.1 hypothetical protein VCUG_01904 [Vavraia culicis subsp. floridensis]
MKDKKWQMSDDEMDECMRNRYPRETHVRVSDVPFNDSIGMVAHGRDGCSPVKYSMPEMRKISRYGTTNAARMNTGNDEENGAAKEISVDNNNSNWCRENDENDEKNDLLDGNRSSGEEYAENTSCTVRGDKSDVAKEKRSVEPGILHDTHEMHYTDKLDTCQEILYEDKENPIGSAAVKKCFDDDDSAKEAIFRNDPLENKSVGVDRSGRTNSVFLKHGYQDRKFSIIREIQNSRFGGITRHDIELFRYFLWKIHRCDVNRQNSTISDRTNESGMCNSLYRDNWHVAIHESDREYKCDHCDFTYIYRKCLITHMRKRHQRK